MNVFEDRSTISDDVKKWSNECVAATELWADKLLILMSEMLHSIVKQSDALTIVWLSKLHLMLMSSDALTIVSMSETLHSALSRSNEKLLMPELLHSIAMRLDALTIVWLSKLHLMPMSSDALAVVWLSGCCTRSWNDQMHADGCLLRKLVAANWLQRHSRWNVEVCIRCWNRQMHWRFFDFFFRRIEAQQLSVDADETSDACWSCRLTDWLQNKLLTDDADWASDARFHWLRMIFFIHRRFFFSLFLTFFEL